MVEKCFGDPFQSPRWNILHNNYEEFKANYDESYEKQYGFFRLVAVSSPFCRGRFGKTNIFAKDKGQQTRSQLKQLNFYSEEQVHYTA